MSAEAKAYRGLGMEGFIARWYATNTRKGIEELETLATRVASELRSGSSVLEVAPGPGYFAIELAKRGCYRVTGLDISRTFVEIARRNANDEGVDVEFREGNAARMPFADRSFDFIFCRAAFKNFAEPERAVEEMHRVLRPDGRLLLIDLRRNASTRDINEQVDKMGMSPLNALFTKLTFRFMLLKRAYTRKELEPWFSEAEFQEISIEEDLTGLEVRAKK